MPDAVRLSEQGLLRLIYTSRRTLPDGPAADDALDDIVQASADHNLACAITGLLLARQGWFLQALEGPGPAVIAAFHRIFADPRHRDIRVIITGPISRRAFPGRPMAARALTRAEEPGIAWLDEPWGFDPERLSCRSAMWLLTTILDLPEPGSASTKTEPFSDSSGSFPVPPPKGVVFEGQRASPCR